MDLKYLTKEGSWEKNLIYRRRFAWKAWLELLVTIYRAGGQGCIHGFAESWLSGIEKNFDLGAQARRTAFMWCCIITAAAGAVMGRMPMRIIWRDADTLLEFIETNTTYGFDQEQLFVAGIVAVL